MRLQPAARNRPNERPMIRKMEAKQHFGRTQGILYTPQCFERTIFLKILWRIFRICVIGFCFAICDFESKPLEIGRIFVLLLRAPRERLAIFR